MADGWDRVSVSLDTLRSEIRAANGELELSLRKYIAAELDKKASADTVLQMATQLSELRETAMRRDGPLAKTLQDFAEEFEHFARGELTPPQENTVRRMIASVLDARTDQRWTRRERMIAVAVGLLYLLSFAVSAMTLLLAHHHG